MVPTDRNGAKEPSQQAFGGFIVVKSLKSCCDESGSSGGGDGFFLACEYFGKMFDHSFPTCTIVCFVF